jgi:Na+/melibiose symporter-like transporter
MSLASIIALDSDVIPLVYCLGTISVLELSWTENEPARNEEAMASPAHRLPLYEKIGYSFGDAAANLVWRGALAFLAVFYTDTFGLDALAVGALLLVVRLSDGVTDIIMGMIADRTESRWGKFRPWVLFSAPALGVFMVLTFTTPDLSPTLKLVWAYLSYIGLTLAYTMNNVPCASP